MKERTILRNDWTKEEIEEIYNLPLLELIYKAATVHREWHNPEEVQMSTLLSIKTGGCPEDCSYCGQAARYHTDIKVQALLSTETVIEHAKKANELGMEVCCTLGMLTEEQAIRLQEAGLYAYNHNLDTSEQYYEEIISTRTFDNRINTINNVRKAGITVCSGGIIGLGETHGDRISMLLTLATMPKHPESVPINALARVKGTPLENNEKTDTWEMVRMIATARIIMPSSMVRLSAGRIEMTDFEQGWCFMAGANSIFTGERETLLVTPNPGVSEDLQLLKTLGLKPMVKEKTMC